MEKICATNNETGNGTACDCQNHSSLSAKHPNDTEGLQKGAFTNKTCKDQINAQNGDAMALLGHACRDVSMRRRFSIHPYLPKHLKGLCSDSVPVTSQLFGDNITAL